ncbi:MAG TPA: IS1634 family transposase, partial [Streptosporangiaceae bacterium]|nr:IS1634 family transposase [Streptosporangiaceae bacterium]
MIVVMYVVKVPNRGSPPAVLLRESYREAGKVKNRTLANLSSWPEAKVEALSRVLKGQPPPAAPLDEAFEITRSLPHGHVAAVLGTARQLGLEELIDPVPSRHRDLVTAMAVAQVIAPDSKLAIARGLRDQTAATSLGEILGLGSCDEDDLYAAMDYLQARQDAIQDALAARHLAGGTLVLYDVSSAAFEGRTCPLGAIGHPKDGVRGRLQIVYGLLTSPEGIPVAIEVFAGNTGDPTTVKSQVDKVKDRFGITKVVLVGDRGMLTAARLREDVRPAHLDWITAPRAPQVKALVRDGDLQLTLSGQIDLAEITSPDFPGERLVACKNPFLAAERARKRESLLAATEAGLEKIAAACTRTRRPLRGQDTIAVRADRVLARRKVAKHFTIDIGEDHLRYARNQDSIAAEAALDGIYVLRTSVAAPDLDPAGVVSSYKALAQVERAFRAFNTDLDIRPIRHRTADRVRAHVFLRMISYYITWHMQARLAHLLFTDDDKP